MSGYRGWSERCVLTFLEDVPCTTAKDIMGMVLVTQYFDTIKEIGAASNSYSVFIPHGPGAVKDVVSYYLRSELVDSDLSRYGYI